MIYALDRIRFWFRTRHLRLKMEIALELRKRGRAKRQAAARKAADTRFTQRTEGLRR